MNGIIINKASTVFDFDIKLNEIIIIKLEPAVLTPLIIRYNGKTIELEYGMKHHLEERKYGQNVKKTIAWNNPHIEAYHNLYKAYAYIIAKSSVTNKDKLFASLKQKEDGLTEFSETVKFRASVVQTFIDATTEECRRNSIAKQQRSAEISIAAEKIAKEIVNEIDRRL